MSKSSWLSRPASRLTATDTGTITGWTRSSGVSSRHITVAARYHIGQRGFWNHSSGPGSPSA